MNSLFSVFLFLLSTSVYANSELQGLFGQLKDSGEKYSVAGTVCEQVARLELLKQYPAPQYEVVTGIAYADNRRVIGELDVVVFKNSDHRAVLIAEVKCWQNMRNGAKKAQEQRARFQSTMSSGRTDLSFFLANRREVVFRRPQFEGTPRFISIAQEGSESAGFQDELPYTLGELMELRQMLMDCQDRGRCRKAD
jgi:hypothetical protein